MADFHIAITHVVAKVRCDAVRDEYASKAVVLSPVYGDEGENHDFSAATPWGSITLGITPDAPAAAYFVPGEFYYVTFMRQAPHTAGHHASPSEPAKRD